MSSQPRNTVATQTVTSGEPVPPHGGRLIDLLVNGPEAEAIRERVATGDGETLGAGPV